MKNLTNTIQLLGKVITFISTFNGIGAFTDALKQMGIKLDPKFICENNKKANETYYNNNPFDPKKHIDDIRVLLKKVKKGLKIHLLLQTPECQPFSIAGFRKGLKSKSGNLFLTAIQLQKKVNASIVVYENVKGLISHDKKVGEYKSLINKDYKNTIGHTLHTIEKLLLEDDRYNYYWTVLNSNEQGLPQNRERIFIVGIKKELDKTNTFSFPKKIDIKFTVKDILENNVEEHYYYKNKANHKLVPTNQKRRKNKIHTIHKFSETMSYETSRRVLAPYVAACFTTNNEGKYLIDGRIRYLTPTEQKRVHGFNEEFNLVGSKTTQNKQLGNTVSPGVYVRLFTEVFKQVDLGVKIKSKRGRKPKKTQIVDNNINITKNIVNNPDLRYLNIKEERLEEYKNHLKNGGTITLTINKYKSVEDKKEGIIDSTYIINIKDLEKLGYRNKKENVFRCKIIEEKRVISKKVRPKKKTISLDFKKYIISTLVLNKEPINNPHFNNNIFTINQKTIDKLSFKNLLNIKRYRYNNYSNNINYKPKIKLIS